MMTQKHPMTGNLPHARAQRLKWVRHIANLTVRELEERFGINASTYTGWEAARHGGLTDKGARKMIDALRERGVECSLSWLLEGEGELPRITRLPGTKALSGKNDTEDKRIEDELAVFRKHFPTAVDLCVKDDAMAPIFLPGDRIAGVPFKIADKTSHAKIVGAHCIVQTIEGELLLRQVRTGDQPQHYDLWCLNPDTEVKKPVLYDVSIYSAAPVIWWRRPFSLIA